MSSCWDSFVGALQPANDSKNGVKPDSCYHSHTHAAFLRQLKCGQQLEVVIVSWGAGKAHIHTHAEIKNEVLFPFSCNF